ncbi:MAG: tetratricopeptide repeat protein [Rhodospirillales bacterium]|nr:tetratricopeptide repeat protein [Rhodospirillales bacterium]
MSILFKALARAAEANEARRAEALEPPPAPMSLPEPGEGPPAEAPQLIARKKVRPLRLVLIALVALLGGTLAALFFMGEDLMLLVEDLTGETPPRPATPPKPPPPKPAAQIPPAPTLPPAPPPAETKTEPAPEPSSPAETKTAETRKSAPAAKPKPSPAEQAKVIEDTRRAASADLPGLLEAVRKRKDADVLKPPVELASAKAAPSSTAAATLAAEGAAVEMVSVRAPSGKARDELDAAYAALMRGQYEAALRLYQSVLAGDPRNVAAMMGKGSALHKLRRHAEARDLYDRVLELDPGNREALSNLLALFGTESPREAIQQLIKLMRDNPSFSPIPAQIANLYAQTEDLNAAIRYQSQALALSPENLLYRINLAVLQDRAGMAAEALSSYEAVLGSLGEGKGGLPVPEAQIRERVKYLRRR